MTLLRHTKAGLTKQFNLIEPGRLLTNPKKSVIYCPVLLQFNPKNDLKTLSSANWTVSLFFTNFNRTLTFNAKSLS